jgi:hypothetical protein
MDDAVIMKSFTHINVYSLYYGPNGLEYNLGRIPMGGVDFSTRTYTYDDEEYDTTLEKFSLTDEDFLYKVRDFDLFHSYENLKTYIHFLSKVKTSFSDPSHQESKRSESRLETLCISMDCSEMDEDQQRFYRSGDTKA